MTRVTPATLLTLIIAITIAAPRLSSGQAAPGSEAQCSSAPARGPECYPEHHDYSDSAPLWYTVLLERTDAFCNFYFDSVINKRPFPSPSQFRIPGFGNKQYVYSPSEVQALIKYCGAYYRSAKKLWEESHPWNYPSAGEKKTN